MEMKLNIGIEPLLGLIKQLPANQIAKLKTGIPGSLINKGSYTHTAFQQVLLSGPVMNNEQQTLFDQTQDIYLHAPIYHRTTKDM